MKINGNPTEQLSTKEQLKDQPNNDDSPKRSKKRKSFSKKKKRRRTKQQKTEEARIAQHRHRDEDIVSSVDNNYAEKNCKKEFLSLPSKNQNSKVKNWFREN